MGNNRGGETLRIKAGNDSSLVLSTIHRVLKGILLVLLLLPRHRLIRKLFVIPVFFLGPGSGKASKQALKRYDGLAQVSLLVSSCICLLFPPSYARDLTASSSRWVLRVDLPAHEADRNGANDVSAVGVMRVQWEGCLQPFVALPQTFDVGIHVLLEATIPDRAQGQRLLQHVPVCRPLKRFASRSPQV